VGKQAGKELKMLADAHTHLDLVAANQLQLFGGKTLPQLIADAKSSGVGIIITASTSLESSQQNISIAHSYPGVFPAVGLHPWWPLTIDPTTYQRLRELATSGTVVAISEIGLDYNRNLFTGQDLSDPETREVQQQAFRQQLQLAREVKLPVIVHCGGAHQDTMDILGTENAADIGGAAHGFHGDVAALRNWLDLGFYISIGIRSISVLEETPGLKETYQQIPLERLLLETDQDPVGVPLVASKFAELKAATVDEIAEATTNNLKRLLRLPR